MRLNRLAILLQPLGRRLDGWYARYRRLFWTLHSIWALFWGAGVLVLAHNRYGYLPWVVSFLGLTWVSTLFFTRLLTPTPSRAMRYTQEFISYLTRVMYQGALFFLIPFYAYSTTFPSPNAAFLALLVALAVFSCFDLPFDRLLRTRPAFALAFFAVVTFAALNFFFPLFFGTRLHVGTYLAVTLSVAAALPLAYSFRELFRPRLAVKAVALLLIALAAGRALRPILPPVPLRLTKVRFAAELNPTTLASPREWSASIPESELGQGKLYVVATLFSPTAIRTTVVVKTLRSEVVVRNSQVVEFVAHDRGFRVWDMVPLARLAEASSTRSARGPFLVELWTAEGHLIGRAAAAIQ